MYGHLSANVYNSIVQRGIEEASINKIVLNAAFLRLSTRHQTVLGLLSNGLTQQNVADIIGMSRTSVGTDKKTATALLQKYISDCRGYGEN